MCGTIADLSTGSHADVEHISCLSTGHRIADACIRLAYPSTGHEAEAKGSVPGIAQSKREMIPHFSTGDIA
eukprot:3292309-Rhodomonas_salina.3